MNYKLRNDYVFFAKGNTPMRNKIDKDGNIVGEQIVISDKEHSVEGQLHKLEEVKAAKPAPKPPKEEGDKKDDKPKPAPKPELPATATEEPGDGKQGNTEKPSLQSRLQ